MAGMNRLSSWIVRASVLRPLPRRVNVAALAMTSGSAVLNDDLRLFATMWAGGVVFFGTLFG